MNTRGINLVLMFFWLALLVAVIYRDRWLPPGTFPNQDESAKTAQLLCGLLIAWNLGRFIVARQRGSAPPRQPSPRVLEYRRRLEAMNGQEPPVTDPQFRFEDAEPPPPK